MKFLVAAVAMLVLAGAAAAATPTGTITANIEVQGFCDVVVTGSTHTSTGGGNTITVSVSDGVTAHQSTTGTAAGRDGFYVHSFSLVIATPHTVTVVATLKNKNTVLDTATVVAAADCAWA